MIGLSLQWERCLDGIDVWDFGPETLPKSGETIFAHAVQKTGIWLCSRSDRRETVRYEITDLETPIVMRFLNAKDDDLRADFLGRFGMLLELHGTRGEVSGDEVQIWQAELHKLLEKASGDDPMAALEAVNKAIMAHGKFASFPVLTFADNAKRPRLTLRPQNLLALMLMEIATVAEVNARTAACDHCGTLFLTGSLTGRRSHAKYCSDRCRVAAMRERNKEKR